MRQPTRRIFWSASVLTGVVMSLALPLSAASAADTSAPPAPTNNVIRASIPTPVGEPAMEVLELVDNLTGVNRG
jgi:hypothetical protein